MALAFKGIHFDFKAIVAAVVALGLLFYVVSLANSSESLGLILLIIKRTWWIAFISVIPYLLGRLIVWRSLLGELNIKISFKYLLIAFLVGEVSKSLPMGIYVESFLLNRFNSFDYKDKTRSYLATTAMLALESLVAVLTLLIININSLPWLRGTIVGVSIGWIVLLFLVWKILNSDISVKFLKRLERVKKIILEFFKESKELIEWRTLKLLIPTVIYILAYCFDLYMIIKLAGFGSITFLQSVAVFAFFLITTILIPVPTELGIVEFSGLEALIAIGLSQKDAAAVMLGLRVVFTGAVFLVSGVILFFLRRSFKGFDRH